jgi:hypothetical protein
VKIDSTHPSQEQIRRGHQYVSSEFAAVAGRGGGGMVFGCLTYNTCCIFYLYTLCYTLFSIHTPDRPIDWRSIQTLVRSMPDLHKTLILVNVKRRDDPDGDGDVGSSGCYDIKELAIGTEHAPFRHKHINRIRNKKSVGAQLKRK